MDLAPGVLVNDNLRLERLLGEGGMGSVWVAEHLALRTRVAVKFLAAELLAGSPEVVARFSREASAAAQLKSPHVVQIFDHGLTADGTPYISMELLEGEDLGARLDREGTLPLGKVGEILTQAAKALGRAHAAGIVHRDIKPDNIFLVRDAEGESEIFVKLLDFGVAKQTGAATYSVLTATGAMIGTPAYMSPEQVLTSKHVDFRSDLWSLGVVAYHAMVGDIPFEGDTLGALCVSISRGAIAPPSKHVRSIPPAIDAWVARALTLDPAGRFQSAREMAVAFNEALQAAGATAAAGTVVATPAEVQPAAPGSSAATRIVPPRPHPSAAAAPVGAMAFDGGESLAPMPAGVSRRRPALRAAVVGALLVAAVLVAWGLRSNLDSNDDALRRGPATSGAAASSATASAPPDGSPTTVDAPTETALGGAASVGAAATTTGSAGSTPSQTLVPGPRVGPPARATVGTTPPPPASTAHPPKPPATTPTATPTQDRGF